MQKRKRQTKNLIVDLGLALPTPVHKQNVMQSELIHILYYGIENCCGFDGDSERLMRLVAKQYDGWLDQDEVNCYIVCDISTQKQTMKLLRQFLLESKNSRYRELLVYLPDLNLSCELFLMGTSLQERIFEWTDVSKVLAEFWGRCPKDHPTLKHISRKYKRPDY